MTGLLDRFSPARQLTVVGAALAAALAAPVLVGTTPADAATATRYLSQLTPESVTNGWGPLEVDRANGERAAGDGPRMTIGKRRFSKGLGVHAGSEVRFAVPAGCTRFSATVGVDGSRGSGGSVVFQVFDEAAKAFDSGRMTGSSRARSFTRTVTAGGTLRLVVTDAGDGNTYDHANWASARLRCSRTSAPAVREAPATAAAPEPVPSTGIPADPTRVFMSGDAFWKPIPANPRLDANNGPISAKLAESGVHRVALTERYANPIYNADASTPRYKLNVLNAGTSKWGDNDLNHTTVPVPAGAVPSSGSDGKLIIVDWSQRKVFDLWQLKPNGNTFDVSWGGVYPLDGDGSSHNVMYHDPKNPSPYTVAWPQPVSRGTGSGISSAAGTIRLSEIEAGHIPHALVFATDIPCGPANTGPFRWPATSTDGFVTSGTCIPQGARIQLDPSVDLSRIPGITKAELAVGRALQTYGAYVVDKGGSRISFGFERVRAGEPNPYTAAGMTQDYFQFTKLPWNTIRVLNSWDGA